MATLEKRGGGGKMQPYTDRNGEYIDKGSKTAPGDKTGYNSNQPLHTNIVKNAKKSKTEKFGEKAPIRQDYINKYGFEGDARWRLARIDYQERKNAWERAQSNRKESAKLLRDYTTDPIKNKNDILDFVERQFKVRLENEPGPLNSKRKSLYTVIPKEIKNTLLPILKSHGVVAELHLPNEDRYWLHIRN